MSRHPFKVAMVMGLMIVAGPSLLAQDKVTYSVPDGKGGRRAATAEGKIESESLKGVVIDISVGSDPKRNISAADIADVEHYYELKLNRNEYRLGVKSEDGAAKAANAQDRKKALQDAKKSFQTILPQLTGTKFAARHVQYKLATIQAKLAETDAEVKAAIEELKKFSDEHLESWQRPACMMLMAQLQSEAKDLKGAAQTLDTLAKLPGLPKAEQDRFDLDSIQLLIRGKAYTDATKRANQRLLDIKQGPLHTKLEMLQKGAIACDPAKFEAGRAELAKAISKIDAKDQSLHGFAHNVLGDVLLANNKAKEALYEYLYVDVIYNQDRNEHIKACTQLASLFSQLKQEGRAQEYKTKIDALKR